MYGMSLEQKLQTIYCKLLLPVFLTVSKMACSLLNPSAGCSLPMTLVYSLLICLNKKKVDK